MSSFQSAVILVPLELFASGMQNLAATLKTAVNQQISSATSDGVALKARQIGCELPDTTVIRLTPSQVRILDLPPAQYESQSGCGKAMTSGPGVSA